MEIDIDQVIDFLDGIYGNQPLGYVCLSTKNRQTDRWRDRFYENADQALEWLQQNGKDVIQSSDLYFCPTTLSKPRRKKENVLKSRYLWSDLDYADPQGFDDKWRPDIVWESSPGRWQCLWTLDKLYNPEGVESRNKGLAHLLEADLGGWDLTQVLRVPGSINHKYPEKPSVILLWEEEGVHKLGHFPRYTDQTKDEKKDKKEDYEASRISIREAIRKHGRKLPRKARNHLLARRAEEGKRSDILWYLAHELAKAEFPRGAALTCLQSCVWNKYRGRTDENERLRHELKAGYTAAREAKAFTSKEEENGEQLGRIGKAISLSRFYTREIAEQRWLVDKVWTVNGHGIVAGEPKSYKSQLVLDMAFAIASGQPFLDQFEVPNPGPVLIVQNENSDWDMRNRFSDIATAYNQQGTIRKLADGQIRMRLPVDIPLFLQQLPTGFYLDEPEYLESLGEVVRDIQPKLVIFDPLVNMFSGDFNSAQELRPILADLFKFKKQYDTGVLIVHHKHKNSGGKRGGQGMMGSMVLHAWTESAWYVDNVIEKEKEEEISTERSFSEVTIEREIRGSVPHPRLYVRIYNNPEYKLKVLGSKIQYEIRESILLQLSTSARTSSQLQESLGKDRKPVMKALRALREEKIVKKKGDTYSLRKKPMVSSEEEIVDG